MWLSVRVAEWRMPECECPRVRVLLIASLANVQECECARVRVRLSASIVVLALLHVLVLEVVQVLHEPAALSTPDYPNHKCC